MSLTTTSPFWFSSGATSAGGGGTVVYPYSIDQSLRFNDDDSPDLARAYSTTQTDTKIITISFWVKRSNISNSRSTIIFAKSGGAGRIAFEANDTLLANAFDTGYNGFTSSAVFRDTSAWYHIVYQGDSTQARASARNKVWVNGVEQTNSVSSSLTPQNSATNILRNGNTTYIGRDTDSSSYYFDGYIAEMHVVDGSIINPSEFGQFVNGVWTPKEVSGLTYGTNGFYLPFAQDTASGNSIQFDSGSDQVQHSDTTAYDIGSSDDFTIEFFMKSNEVGGGSSYGNILGHYATGGPHHLISYDVRNAARKLNFYSGNGQAVQWDVTVDETFNNNTWYHVVFQRNGTTLRAYFNGTRLTSASNAGASWTLSDGKATNFNASYNLSHIRLGNIYASNAIIGSLSNVRYVIGSSVYADDDNNITVPTSSLTAVTNTKLLTAVNSTLGDDISTFNNDGSVSGATLSYDSPFTTSNFFDDASGNNNDFTASNLDVDDVMLDSPTNNMAVLSAVNKYTNAASDDVREGGLEERGNSSGYAGTVTFDATDTDGYYYEVTHTGTPGTGCTHGMMNFTDSINQYGGIPGDSDRSGWWGVYRRGAGGSNQFWYYLDGVETATLGVAGAANDVWMYLIKDGKFYIGRNGTWFNSADPSAGTGHYASGLTGTDWTIFSGNGSNVSGGHKIRVDRNLWDYGDASYKEIKASNIAAPAIGPQQASGEQSDDYFEPILYTGTGATQHIGSGGAQHPVDVVTVGNSCRFNSGDSARFNNSSRPAGDRQQFTISFWFKQGKLGVQRQFFEGAMDSGQGFFASFNASNQLYLYDFNVAGGGFQIYGGPTFTDTSKWHNMVIAVDTPQATNSDRIKVWVDNEQLDLSTFTVGSGASAWPDQNSSFTWNNGGNTSIGYGNSSYWDGYLAEFVHIEGSVLDPTSFGQYGSNGYWIPKDVSGLTFGDEGFYLDFSDNSTASALGTDSSGNSNNFSATNIATTDQMGDSPTQSFNTFNPKNSYSSGSRLSEGNLRYTHDGVNGHHTTNLSFNSSGNWYWEVGLTNSISAWLGIVDANQICTGSQSINGYFWYAGNGYISTNPYVASDAWSTVPSVGDIIGFQINNGVMTIYKNGVSLGNPFTIPTSGYYRPFVMSPGAGTGITTFNFGADDSFAGSETPSSGAQAADANGYGSFYYTPPTGALAIVDDNIPVEGITGPDFVWIKNRDVAADHYLVDSVRGDYKQLISNSTAAESTNTTNGTKLDYDGFTVGGLGDTNSSGKSYVSWNWKAGGKANTFNVDGTGYASMTAAGLTDGDIALTGLSVNTTSGFSIGTYTGIGAAGPSTVAHGLGKQVQLVMVKGRNNSDYSFAVYTRAGDADGSTFMNTGGQVGGTPASTSGLFTQDAFGSGSGTFNDSFFSIGGPNNYTSQSYDYLFYAFANVEGFSKHGKYVGNGSTDGTFVYTGFRPAFVLLKVSSAANNWFIYDNKREGYNQENDTLSPNLNTVEDTSYKLDLVSNGFKIRGSNNAHNQTGQTFIYLAFAEQPFKYANAR